MKPCIARLFRADLPGRLDWVKVKSRETAEVILGAVTGPIRQPESVVVGLMVNGQLVMVGKSVPLFKTQSDALATPRSGSGYGRSRGPPRRFVGPQIS